MPRENALYWFRKLINRIYNTEEYYTNTLYKAICLLSIRIKIIRVNFKFEKLRK